MLGMLLNVNTDLDQLVVIHGRLVVHTVPKTGLIWPVSHWQPFMALTSFLSFLLWWCLLFSFCECDLLLDEFQKVELNTQRVHIAKILSPGWQVAPKTIMTVYIPTNNTWGHLLSHSFSTFANFLAPNYLFVVIMHLVLIASIKRCGEVTFMKLSHQVAAESGRQQTTVTHWEDCKFPGLKGRLGPCRWPREGSSNPRF